MFAFCVYLFFVPTSPFLFLISNAPMTILELVVAWEQASERICWLHKTSAWVDGASAEKIGSYQLPVYTGFMTSVYESARYATVRGN